MHTGLSFCEAAFASIHDGEVSNRPCDLALAGARAELSRRLSSHPDYDQLCSVQCWEQRSQHGQRHWLELNYSRLDATSTRHVCFWQHEVRGLVKRLLTKAAARFSDAVVSGLSARRTSGCTLGEYRLLLEEGPNQRRTSKRAPGWLLCRRWAVGLMSDEAGEKSL